MNDLTLKSDLDRIEQAARAATPGRWTWWDETSLVGMDESGEEVLGYITDQDTGMVDNYDDATHIETADPETVLALVAEVRRLRAVIDRLTTDDAVVEAAVRAMRKDAREKGLTLEPWCASQWLPDGVPVMARAALVAAVEEAQK